MQWRVKKVPKKKVHAVESKKSSKKKSSCSGSKNVPSKGGVVRGPFAWPRVGEFWVGPQPGHDAHALAEHEAGIQAHAEGEEHGRHVKNSVHETVVVEDARAGGELKVGTLGVNRRFLN